MKNKSCNKATKIIKIGYLKNNKEQFISNIVVTDNFLNLLTNFVQVVKISVNSNNFNFQELEKLNIDYLLTDIKNFGIKQFIFREKNQINIRFIIILHTVYRWIIPLMYIMPLIRKDDIIIAPSEYAKKSFLKISGKFKVHVVPYCLDVMQIQKYTESGLIKSAKEITFMGRLAKDKGIEILIDCIPAIISKVGNVNLNIIGPLSGDSIKNYPKSPFVISLESKVRNLGLTNNVFFKGAQFNLDKYKMLSKSDVFVYPTIEKGEILGMSIIEAIACGIPVITTNLAGPRELVKDGENGYLVNIDFGKNKKLEIDKQQMVSLIAKVLQDDKLNLKMKRKACKMAREYDFRKIVPRLIKLLKRKKYIKTQNENRWRLLRNKKIIDFKDFYKREILFFLYISGIGYKTYSDIHNDEIKNLISPIVKTHPKKNRYIKDMNQDVRQRLIRELFRYLCLQ